ncbi:hypothetical protein GCM10010331_15690 [Streptomyces xanthochromogenes]|nr:hypothetical protein GCM10010331_15690 [Streptomyces xanthochromogenes]
MLSQYALLNMMACARYEHVEICESVSHAELTIWRLAREERFTSMVGDTEYDVERAARMREGVGIPGQPVTSARFSSPRRRFHPWGRLAREGTAVGEVWPTVNLGGMAGPLGPCLVPGATQRPRAVQLMKPAIRPVCPVPDDLVCGHDCDMRRPGQPRCKQQRVPDDLVPVGRMRVLPLTIWSRAVAMIEVAVPEGRSS